MDIARRNEIEACIKTYFLDSLKLSVNGKDSYAVYVKDLYNEVLPCISVQWWYCEEYNKIYIYYDTGKLYFIGNIDDFDRSINTRILSSMYSDLHIHPEIVSNIIYGNQHIEPMDSPYVFSNEKITLNVLTYWEMFDGGYDFIHDSHIIMNKMLDNSMVITKEKEQHIQEYISKLKVIYNNYESYDFDKRNKRIPEVFKDIQALFTEYFGYSLPDPTIYNIIHPNCGPNRLFLEVQLIDYYNHDAPEEQEGE